MDKISLTSFYFRFAGCGQYIVTYTTPTRGDYWRARINDMSLIDDTKNAEELTKAALYRLRDAVKYYGIHYRRNGEPIE